MGKVTLSLPLRKWGAKIFVVFKSFGYQIAANWTLSKLASSHNPPRAYYALCAKSLLVANLKTPSSM